MDGYALRAADTPGRLPVVASVAAGRPVDRPLRPGEAMAIATGGVVPEGADAVVPLEQVVSLDGKVDVPAVPAGANIRPRGGDVAAGGMVVAAGARLGPAQIGALAAAGVAEVRCRRRPRVAVVATGTELRRPGQPLAPGEVYEANGAMLAAQVEAAGAEVERLEPVGDDEEAHREAISRGLESDVLITTGGVSVGTLGMPRLPPIQQCTSVTRPMAPERTSSTTRWMFAIVWRCTPSCVASFFSRASVHSVRTSQTLWASGFSRYTCLPRCSAQ